MKKRQLRFITAAALFDGHDVTINILRRLLQEKGVEVIHLGHNRSVDDIITAALQEDADGISVSSYQGGHIEFYKYIIEQLHKNNASHIQVFGGGGGVILPKEIEELERFGVRKIFSPEDGKMMGLEGMIDFMIEECLKINKPDKIPLTQIEAGNKKELTRWITAIENKEITHTFKKENKNTVVIGITGTGGAGKSTLTDELLLRLLQIYPAANFGIISVDPTKRRTQGALLGDRIRMNVVNHPRVFLRSLATRDSPTELSNAVADSVSLLSSVGYNIILVETSGIGQGDAAVVSLVDISMYVMTAEYGAPTQLEKIDMLDYADLVVINKFDKRGSEDALKFVQKQYQRNHSSFDKHPSEMPVYGTVAHRFHDGGVNRLCTAICEKIDLLLQGELVKNEVQLKAWEERAIIPIERQNYLRTVTGVIRNYNQSIEADGKKLDQYEYLLKTSKDKELDEGLREEISKVVNEKYEILPTEAKRFLLDFPKRIEDYSKEKLTYKVRDKEIHLPLRFVSLSGLSIPKIALPKYKGFYDLYKWYKKENLPGFYPFTAGVFQLKRTEEDPKRQFAGEGGPKRTNARFHYLSENDTAKRLSVAFDSVTLYGEDPHMRQDIFGKIGESGVSICTLDNMKELFLGFDLCHPSTSVSMTINGPAPIILAMYFQAAISQQVEKEERRLNRNVTNEERVIIENATLKQVRGTVQADILKEDQGQNTCIFSTDFALRLMGDMQEYFIEKSIRNYYSVSISGYHIAEAGANPVSQLAFTLANGFTYVEYYRSRGMNIDDFAQNLSFFFSNGLDPEYSVIGRVARRIWAVAMKENYKASERSQKLKYHIQTSGRSLHAEEMDFNDIRTTLQALLAYYDHCNSLHTNAYDEAVTTPTEESVRRAMAIQLIIAKEFGLASNENPNQGSFIIEELTDLVEEAVILELERIDDRGGVIGAMEVQYQRSKIQEESLYYETLKHNRTLPIIGVTTFVQEKAKSVDRDQLPVARASNEEKQAQVDHVLEFRAKHKLESPKALSKLKEAAYRGENLFPYIMDCVLVCSLGEITQALYSIGGQYRRNM